MQSLIFSKFNPSEFILLTNGIKLNRLISLTKRNFFLSPTEANKTALSRFQLKSQAFFQIRRLNSTETSKPVEPKKKSKFKTFYTQYGPLFVVVHLTTVVITLYAFFTISKQFVVYSLKYF
jgi:hypothetical protein